ncbi:hypothetical protein JZO80_02855 [Vagococcus fluvialis]|uniref:hypothetical protein n=1 Tax=Vagococcus fluvialis TaxID=2738 RepID=UPI000A34E2E6|nr:hypothetical protein [Vagococcus fluvialis]MBO0419088.1 hypothetical protein [Vagococcus fluvialis]OTP29513.1 hypothetical protein A5798_002681 [Enterococcus sp. 6C8_DIV0013]
MKIEEIKHNPGIRIDLKINNGSSVFDIEINRTDYGTAMTDIDNFVEDFSDEELDALDDLLSALSTILIMN